MAQQQSLREQNDDAARLLTSHASFRSLVDACGRGYTPTVRVEQYFSRGHKRQARHLRRQLTAIDCRVSPAWGTYEGEEAIEVADRHDGLAMLCQAVTS